MKFPWLARFTERDRERIDVFMRSPEFAEVTQRDFRERLTRRVELVQASEQRRVGLRKQIDACGPKVKAANERVASAEQELRAAREAASVAALQGYGAQLALDREIGALHAQLREENDPRIAELFFAARELDENVRVAVMFRAHVEKDDIGRRVPAHYSNLAEVAIARQQIAGVLDELRVLSEGIYPPNLLEIFDRHLKTLHDIAAQFGCGDVVGQQLLEVEERGKDERHLASLVAK